MSNAWSFDSYSVIVWSSLWFQDRLVSLLQILNMPLTSHCGWEIIHWSSKINCLPLLLIGPWAFVHGLLVWMTHVKNTCTSFTIQRYLPSPSSIHSVVASMIHWGLGSYLAIVVLFYRARVRYREILPCSYLISFGCQLLVIEEWIGVFFLSNISTCE